MGPVLKDPKFKTKWKVLVIEGDKAGHAIVVWSELDHFPKFVGPRSQIVPADSFFHSSNYCGVGFVVWEFDIGFPSPRVVCFTAKGVRDFDLN